MSTTVELQRAKSSLAEVEAHRDALADTLREVLAYLPECDGSAGTRLGLAKVVDGTPLVRTPWIAPRLVTRWRTALDEHSGWTAAHQGASS